MPRGPAALLIEGEAGIGKTALVTRAADEARRRGCRVLAAAPTHAESSLSFAGLGDLLAQERHALADLPTPQRRALEVALLLDDGDGGRSDGRAIATGLLGILHGLARTAVVLVAVDDVQWLDASSAAALSFACRRLSNDPVGLVISVRKGSEVPGELHRTLHTERVEVGPLSVGAIHTLLTTQLGLSTPRMILLRIHEACRGNPLVALEIGRALQEHGLPEPGEPFGIPTDIQALFAARLARLPERTLDQLAVAALSAAPIRSLVRAASGGAADELGPAVAAGIVRLEGERVHFTHPLLVSALDARLDATTRRGLHRRIADAVQDAEQRARHLGLGADGPDAGVAAALDQAVGVAAARAAPAAAAELAALSVRLTPEADVDRLVARRTAAAEHYMDAGDPAGARPILQWLVRELPPGRERARVLGMLANSHTGEVKTMLPLRAQAVVEGVGDDTLLAEAESVLGQTLHVAGHPKAGLIHLRSAVDAAVRTGDVRMRVRTMSQLTMFEIWNDRSTPGVLETALALAPQAGYLRVYEEPRTVDGLRLMLLEDDLDGARKRLLASEARAREQGDDNHSAILLNHLAELECRAGRFEVAARCSVESYEIRDQFRFANGAHLAWMGLADALRGDVEAARNAAERGVALCQEAGNEIWTLRNLRVLGFIALSEGDAARAAEILAPLPDRLIGDGYGSVLVQQWLPDSIEALIATGDLARAASQLDQLEDLARRPPTAWARARAARCRGMLAAAKRDPVQASHAFDDALVVHERLPDPLERARTMLAFGEAQRRAGQRRSARDLLGRALAIFEELGAELWKKKARDELGRIGGRTGSSDALTAAEERVARLVADGRTNREVAAALHLTERTVETHLSSVYRKLDVRSRVELARRLAVRTETKIQ